MIQETKTMFKTPFEADVHTGLTSYPKKLSSKYFYDKKGDELFQQIMDLPEYYLTKTEFSIIEENAREIARFFAGDNGFDLIELGAGDGKKTKILLRQLMKENIAFNYLPVDISQNVLDQLTTSLFQEIPGIRVEPQQGMYAEVLEKLTDFKSRKKVILFLGSNLGNLPVDAAIAFLNKISTAMGPEDLLFIGLDQKKDPQVILDAYNDRQGVTAAFNKNILTRINKEMQADFDTDAFEHWPVYNPETGTAKSFLISKKEQTIHIKSLNLKVNFRAWESIHTEISQKYDEHSVNWLAAQSGLEVSGGFTDKNGYFKDYIFTKKG